MYFVYNLHCGRQINISDDDDSEGGVIWPRKKRKRHRTGLESDEDDDNDDTLVIEGDFSISETMALELLSQDNINAYLRLAINSWYIYSVGNH